MVKTENKYEKRKTVNIFQNSKSEEKYANKINERLKNWKIWKMKIIVTIILT